MEFVSVYERPQPSEHKLLDQTHENYQQFYDDAKSAFRLGVSWFNEALAQATNGKYTSITQLLDRD
jgi:hypothetical protein